MSVSASISEKTKRETVELSRRIGTRKAGELVGVNASTVTRWGMALGVSRAPVPEMAVRQPHCDEIDRACRLARRSSVNAAAAALGVSHRRMSRWLALSDAVISDAVE